MNGTVRDFELAILKADARCARLRAMGLNSSAAFEEARVDYLRATLKRLREVRGTPTAALYPDGVSNTVRNVP